jgi:YHS domain-containing protein
MEQKKALKILVILFLVFNQLQAQTEQKRLSTYNLENKLAIKGYDPVAYFLDHKALEGSASYKVIYLGLIYQFSTEAYKKEFLKNPAKYEPQYGGWCAYALGAKNELVDINPETYKIVDGKLYLFYNAYFNNTKTSWDKDQSNLLIKANSNWQKRISN